MPEAVAASRVLITGADGQLGRALRRHAPAGTQCIALGHAALDITSAEAISRVLDREHPDAIINAAAYTAVDRAEREPELAERVNAAAPRLLAQAARGRGVRLLHVSTDFVFDGTQSRPYRPDDVSSPLGIYGRTKRDGERAVLEALPGALVLRSAWVYSEHGHNFVRTMLKLMRSGKPVRVVSDQIGTPTSADGLALALWLAVACGLSGIHHWTDAGVASWYDFAVAIGEEAAGLGLLDTAPRVEPITTVDYPTPAPRPAFSVLDKTATWAALGVTPPHWRVPLRMVLKQIKDQADA